MPVSAGPRGKMVLVPGALQTGRAVISRRELRNEEVAPILEHEFFKIAVRLARLVFLEESGSGLERVCGFRLRATRPKRAW